MFDGDCNIIYDTGSEIYGSPPEKLVGPEHQILARFWTTSRRDRDDRDAL